MIETKWESSLCTEVSFFGMCDIENPFSSGLEPP